MYGTLSHASTSVHLPEITGDGSAFAVASDARYELRGQIDAPALYTRKATAMSSFVVPFARTPLTWSSVGKPGRVSLGLDVSEVFEGTTAAEVELSCEQVSLDAPSYEARAVLVPKRAEDKWLSGNAELFLVPGTPSLARFKRGGMRAWVLDRARGYSRVVVELPRAYAYGWVDSDHVSVVPYGTGGGGFGRVGGRHFGRSATTCPYPLDVRVEVAGVRAVIGSIRPEGTFRAGEVRGDMRVVDLDARWVTLAPNAELLVRASELDGCSRVPKVVGKS